mgnify:CR=1 FL=1
MSSSTNNALWIIGLCTSRMGRSVRQGSIERMVGKLKWYEWRKHSCVGKMNETSQQLFVLELGAKKYKL